MNPANTNGERDTSKVRTWLGVVLVLTLLLAAGMPLSTPADDSSSSGLPKEKLTAEYLEGRWCSVFGGQETTEWLFDAQGDFTIGVPAGSGYAMQPHVRSLEQFHERFESLVAMEPDTFTTLHRFERKNVFTRGSCRR